MTLKTELQATADLLERVVPATTTLTALLNDTLIPLPSFENTAEFIKGAAAKAVGLGGADVVLAGPSENRGPVIEILTVVVDDSGG